MKRNYNQKEIRIASDSLDFKQIFSKDYSSEFLLFEFQKNDFIIQEGFLNDYLFFLINGMAKCFTYSRNGKSQFISYVKFHESVGISGSMWGNMPNCSVQAIEKCLCIALPLHNLREELLSDVIFLRYLCNELRKHLTENNRYLQVSQCTSVESKIAALLLASEVDGISHIDLSSTAEIAGTTYRHVLRILNKFCSNGVIKKKNKNYIITDQEYLRVCSEDSIDHLTNILHNSSK